jgi:hypothetical protein
MKKTIKQEALDHYDRMIKWAKTQNSGGAPDVQIMEKELKESWFSGDCPYCKKYNFCMSSEVCPLQTKVERIHTSCCDGLWINLSISPTWKKWIKNAILVRNFIKKNG